VGCTLGSDNSGTYTVAGTFETDNKIVGSTKNEKCPYQLRDNTVLKDAALRSYRFTLLCPAVVASVG
jgi:hypothetical protein